MQTLVIRRRQLEVLSRALLIRQVSDVLRRELPILHAALPPLDRAQRAAAIVERAADAGIASKVGLALFAWMAWQWGVGLDGAGVNPALRNILADPWLDEGARVARWLERLGSRGGVGR